MSDSSALGLQGESVAAAHLQQKGYKIRHRNWKAGKLEVDIIAENDDFVVFAEVKTRTEGFLGKLSDLVSKDKQKLLILAADSYIRKYDINKESRFDVILLILKGQSLEVEQHIEEAFYPTLR
jgi:putative endonuclease